MFDPMGIVLLLLALPALVLAAIVLVRGELSRRRLLLASFQVALAVYLIGAATMAGDAFTRFPHLARIGEPFVLLLPVLVYAYVKEFLGGGLQRADAFHMLPFAVYVALLTPFYSLSATEKIRAFDQIVASELASAGGVILLLLRLVVVGGYTVAAMRLAEGWQGKVRRVSSDPALMFPWVMSVLRQIMWALVITTLMALLLTVDIIGSMQFGWLTALVLGTAWLIFGWESIIRLEQEVPAWILATGRTTNTASGDWPDLDDLDDVTCTSADEGFIWENPHRAVVTPLESIQERWHLLLRERMSKSEWWREPGLTIHQVADRIGLQLPLLARLIEDRERCGFFDYVNKLRVDAVKRQLSATKSDHVDYTILARSNGFGSRRLMNRVFIRLTGSSPKTYKRLAAFAIMNNHEQA